MEKNQDNKKCFCARCFLPVESEDQVDIDGHHFHRICSMCCICRTIPTTLKMFYGHVFCNECFKSHVMTRFKADNPRVHSNSMWMQWGPGACTQNMNNFAGTASGNQSEQPKRFICARCLQPVDEGHRLTIGDQSFHAQCGQCCVCLKVPSTNLKIYYGQVFCEECFHRHILNRNRDNPSEFFKNCFEQWQNNTQFAENMKEFMGGNRQCSPLIFMMQWQQPPFCRCGNGPQDLFQNNEARPSEARKSATPAISLGEDSQSRDLSFENRTEASIPESNEESAKPQNFTIAAAEKIEKLTKYLHERVEKRNFDDKWNFFDTESSMDIESFFGWIDLHDKTVSRDCPQCLWQCGPIFVNSECIQRSL